MKLLTSRDPIAARFMRAGLFTFRPSPTRWLAGKRADMVRDGGPALWERLRLRTEHVCGVQICT